MLRPLEALVSAELSVAMREAAPFVRQHSKVLLASVVAMAASAVLSVALPLMGREVADADAFFLEPAPGWAIAGKTLRLVAAIAGFHLMSFAGHYLANVGAQRSVAGLTQAALGALLATEPVDVTAVAPSTNTAAVMKAADVLFDVISGCFTNLVLAGVTVIGYVAMVCHISLPLTAAFVVTVGATQAVTRALRTVVLRLGDLRAAEVAALGSVTGLLNAATQRATTLAVFPRGAGLLQRQMQTATAEWTTARAAACFGFHAGFGFDACCTTVALIVLVGVTTYQRVSSEALPTLDLVVYFFYMTQLVKRAQTIAGELDRAGQLAAQTAPLLDILRRARRQQHERRGDDGKLPRPLSIVQEGGHALVVDALTVAPPLPNENGGGSADNGHEERRFCVRDVSFSVPLPPPGVGAILALVGPSGSGKSTILKALAGLIGPWCEVGRVAVHQSFAACTAKQQLQPVVALLEQHAPLLPATIRENIAVGAAAAADGESTVSAASISAACEHARCAAFVRRLPHGVDTSVTSVDAAGISGGEAQRVCLARAFVSPARIVAFDEPTTGLDGTTAAAVVSAISDLVAAGRLVVVASHDLSVLDTLASSHRITAVVMDGGQAKYTGTWDEVRRRGLYR